jgi:Ca2+ transporting ATPase
MTVNLIFDGNENIDTSKLDPQKVTTLFKSKFFELLKISMAVNLNVEFDVKNNKLVIPSKTDNAFALFLEACKENLQLIREKFFPYGMADIKSFPFTSDRKKMSVLISHDSYPSKYRIYTKGASEIILNSCNYYLNPENLEKSTITDEHKGIFGDTIKKYARLTLRTICLAYKDITQQEYEDWEKKDSDGKYDIEERDFTLIGIIGIKDTLRDGVDEAVSKCHTAGISVLMVTGDNIDTAVAIAKDCKILKGDEDETKASMLGSVFHETIGGLMCETCEKDEIKCLCPKTLAEAKKRNIEPDKLRKDKIKNIKVFEEVVSNLKVLARSRPEDKYTLVLGLRQLGNVVAVTGDGTNDAPALSRSDVGFSMGIQGTDIAKNASDIIILDDDFNSIVKAVLWGRNIFDNIRKFIKFQLTVNISAVALVFVCVCIGNETPITTIQMLWLNMIMDSLGSLALATEPPYDKLLYRKPYARDEYIISNFMWKHILPQSLIQFIVLLILYLQAPQFMSEEDSSRITQANYLRNCFGKVPGLDRVNDTYYIISGLSFDWDPQIKLLPNVTQEMCPPYYKSSNLYDALTSFRLENGNSAHMTVVFNTFVFYTLFNQINARILTDDLNIFERIFQNTLFIVIVFIEGILQAIIITFGSRAFQCSNGGLTARQWGKCIGFALLTYPTGLIMKFIPMEKCLDYFFAAWKQRKFCKNKVEIENQDESKRFVEEDAPIEMVQIKNSEAVKNINHNYNNAPPNNANNNLLSQGIFN